MATFSRVSMKSRGYKGEKVQCNCCKLYFPAIEMNDNGQCDECNEKEQEQTVNTPVVNDPNRTETIEVTKLSNKKIPAGYTLKLVYREDTGSNAPWHVKAFYNGQEIAHERNILIAKRAIGKHVRANAEPVVMPYGFRVLAPGDKKFYPMNRGKCIFSAKTGEAVSFKTKQAAENYITREAKKIA